MKISWAKVQKKYKVILAALSMVILGSAGTLGVMAAIPNSATGVISACRNTITGALKAIDTQSGATCGAFETPLSWPSTQPNVPQRAYARLVLDSNNQLILDSAHSLNISSWTVVSTGGTYDTYACFKVPFAPKVALTESMYHELMIWQITGIDGATSASIANLCGGGDYNVVALSVNGTDKGVVSITD